MSEEIKGILKKARKSFKQNDYPDAIKKCKLILKKDKDNYAGLVLLAAAMCKVDTHKERIPSVLQRAVKIEPNNPVGWRGLISYYETNGKSRQDQANLISAYCNALQLEGNDSEYSSLVAKVSELCLRFNDEAALDETVQTLCKLRNQKDTVTDNLITKTIAWILTNQSINTGKYKDLLISILPSIVSDANVVNRLDCYKIYLELLHENDELESFINVAMEMHEDFPNDIFCLEYLCAVYNEHHLLRGSKLNVDIQLICNELSSMNPKSESAAIAKAIHLKDMRKLIEARESANQVLLAKPQSLYAWLLLCDIHTELLCWESAENAIKQTLELGKNKLPVDILHKLEVMLLDSMSRSTNKQKLQTTAVRCAQLLQEEPSVELKIIHARANIFLNHSEIATELNNLKSESGISKVQHSILQALYLKEQGQFEEAVNELENALETSEAWLVLGEIYWEMSEYNRSLLAFLNGVKVNHFNWECLIHLGQYYREHGNDIERSRRCYQTALQINPNSEKAGIGLSTAYRLLKNQDANMQLLQSLTMQDNGPKWAWLQLGFQYLAEENALPAIKAFQHVIKADPSNSHIWSSLADAYLIRGAYTSALRSYQRALELDSTCLYSMIQLANIKLNIGEYTKAKEDFIQILNCKPHYVPALKGLGEACLSLAKENTVNHLLGRARDNLQQAHDNLADAIIQRNELSCLWKLFADVFYRTALLSDEYCYLNIHAALNDNKNEEKYQTATRSEILALCERSYCRALHLCQESALLWHDLAACYFIRLQLDPTVDRQKLAAKCLATAKYAVKLCPTSSIHWNFLGVICVSPYIKNYALAQHCFITVIDKESNNAIVWTNLGTLYLLIGDLVKANEAYSHAQHSDPAYINCWVGQSLIAEKIGRKEAIDLFRHSIYLGYHDQAAIGYAHYVLTVLLNPQLKTQFLHSYMIENMHAVSVSTDVLDWFVGRNPKSAYARNSYGLLLERQSRYRSAMEQFETALQNGCSIEQRDCLRINLGRTLIRLGRYTEAIKLYKTVKNVTFKVKCFLALALFKAEKYEESYATYESALESEAKDNFGKANVLCAMAAMAYIFQGADDAKTLLFQCIQMHQPIVPGLLAAAALGLLHGDVTLTGLILDELKPYKDHNVYGKDIFNLVAYLHLIEGRVQNAIISLCDGVHRHPYDARYWIGLLKILMEVNPKVFERCAQKVLFLNKDAVSTQTIDIACAVSLLKKGDSTANNLKSIQKILFTYPDSIKAWSTFIAIFFPADTKLHSNKYALQWLQMLISAVNEMFCPTGALAEWLCIVQKKISQCREENVSTVMNCCQ